MEGVQRVEFTNCAFEGGLRHKVTAVLTNMDQLVIALRGKRCKNRETCERTGQPHASWAPIVVNGMVTSFPTEEEAEYPRGLCEAAANGIVAWAGTRDVSPSTHGHLFTEVFAGLRAPLSRAVEAAARARGYGAQVFD